MKKHSKLLLIVLIVVLCLTTVLVACNKNDNPPPVEEDYSVTTGEMMSDIIDRIKSSISFGESFGVDVEAEFVIDDKTSANKDVTYKLTAKGNADGRQNAPENGTNFGIELIEQKGEQKSSLFSIAYEAIENEPYFFVSLLGSDHQKINGYSLAALYKMTQKGGTEASGGLDLDMILGQIIGMLFGEFGTVKDNVYTLNFDLADAFTAIASALNLVAADKINPLIEQYLGNLSYQENGKPVFVKDLTTLDGFIKAKVDFTGTIVFTFDENDKFASANASFDCSYENEEKGNYTLNINKVQIGPVATPVDTFANFAMTAEQRKLAQAVNVLNFSLTGEATGLKENGDVAHKYSINVQSDIDAFALLDLLTNGTSKENIVATLKKLGYFHLEINEVSLEDTSVVVQNIIMLHSRFEEGYAVLNVKPYNVQAMMQNKLVAIGGVYDFDALIDVIGMMGENSEPSDPDQPEESITDKINNIVDMVKDIIGYISAENMKENGVTVALEDLVFYVLNALGVMGDGGTTDTILTSAIPGLLGSKNMNIKLQTPKYGTDAEVVEIPSADLICTIRQASALTGGKNDFIKEVTDIPSFKKIALLNDTAENWYENYMDSVSLQLKKAMPMKGINLNGDEVVTSGFIIGVKGFNPAVAGKQTVTFYISIANDLLDLNGLTSLAGIDLTGMPLYGTIKYEVEVDVKAYDEDAQITVNSLQTGNRYTFVGDKTTLQVVGSNSSKITIGEYGSFALTPQNVRIFDNAGKDITTSVVDSEGKFVKTGTYTAKIDYLGYICDCTCTILVEDAYMVRKDGKEEAAEIKLGGTWDFGEYEAFYVGVNGQPVKWNQSQTYSVVTSKQLNEIFDIDNGVYTLKKDLSFVGQDFKICFNNIRTGNQSKSISVAIPITSDYSFTKFGTMYFGNSLNGAAKLSINGVEYSIVYKSNKWVAVSESGSEKEISLTMKWDDFETGEDVIINEYGLIAEYPECKKAGNESHKVYYMLTVDGYYFKSNFTANSLYAGNKLSGMTVGKSTLPRISNDSNIINPVTGTKDYEFKFGNAGYAIYNKITNEKAFDVSISVKTGGSGTNANDKDSYTTDYQLNATNGTFNDAGTYLVTYTVTINGSTHTFWHFVTVNAAA